MTGGIFTAWAVSIGLVTWRAFTEQGRPPLPSQLAATVIVFGTLGVIANSAKANAPATYFAWGLDVAGFLNVIPGIANTKTIGGKQVTSPAVQSAQGAAQVGGIKP